jgi:hypothetical protein
MKNAQLLLDDEESMTVQHIEEGIRQVKVLIKHLAIFFLFPSKNFLPISFQIQLLETSFQKKKEQRQKQLVFFSGVFSLLNLLQSSLTVYILASLSDC